MLISGHNRETPTRNPKLKLKNMVEKMPDWILFFLFGDQIFPDEKMLLILGSVPREGRRESLE